MPPPSRRQIATRNVSSRRCGPRDSTRSASVRQISWRRRAGRPGADDLRVERVRDPDLLPAPLGHDLEQATPLEVVDRLGGRELAQVGEAHRFPDAHDLERVALARRRARRAGARRLPRAGSTARGHRASRHRPPASCSAPASTRTDDQLAEEEGVPAARRPERAERATVDLAAERLGHEPRPSPRTTAPGRRCGRAARPSTARSRVRARASPVRTVTTGKTCGAAARRWSRADEASSSSWASSTSSIRRPPPAASTTAAVARRSASVRPSGVEPETGSSGANTPNGIVAALRFARTCARGPAAGFGEREALRGQPRLADARPAPRGARRRHRRP